MRRLFGIIFCCYNCSHNNLVPLANVRLHVVDPEQEELFPEMSAKDSGEGAESEAEMSQEEAATSPIQPPQGALPLTPYSIYHQELIH